jgi:hypothetical protein
MNKTTQALAVLACLGFAAQASAEGHREEPRLALAAFQTPGLDIARLNHLFDAARLRYQALTTPKQMPEAPKPFRPPTLTRINTPRPELIVPPPVASPAYQRTFNILLNRPDQTDRYDELIIKHAQAYGLEPRLLKAVIAAESEFMISAVSPRGARGLMQVMPATAQYMGVDPSQLHDPIHNIRAGAAYVAHLFKHAFRKFNLKGVRFQDAPLWIKERVIAAYNAGPRFLSHNRWFKETKQYVRKVLLFYGSKVSELRRPPRRFWPTAASYPTDSATLY